MGVIQLKVFSIMYDDVVHKQILFQKLVLVSQAKYERNQMFLRTYLLQEKYPDPTIFVNCSGGIKINLTVTKVGTSMSENGRCI